MADHATTWSEVAARLRDEDIDTLIEHSVESIQTEASASGVSPRDVEIQLRLHLPMYSRPDIQSPRNASLIRELTSLLRPRLHDLKNSQLNAIAESGLPNPDDLSHRSIVCRRGRELTLLHPAGTRQACVVTHPSSDVGQFIEHNLHYLQSPRSDGLFRFGLVCVGRAFPMIYTAFNHCDRDYILSALRKVLPKVRRSDVIILSRIYAVPGVPINAFSSLLKRASMVLRERGFKYIVTALNPMLGFGGSSLFASGFRPFAIAPLHYTYSAQRLYVTRRRDDASLGRLLDTPGNLLLLRPMRHESIERSPDAKTLIRISESDYSFFDEARTRQSEPALAIRPVLNEYRSLLSKSWSPQTAYPGAVQANGWKVGNPRGQCGVSSAWLAHILSSDFAVPSTFCRGSLEFRSSFIEDVRDHCWLELSSIRGNTLVLDLTCDQAPGFHRGIVFDFKSQLDRDGIYYNSRHRLHVSELSASRVWARYEQLLTNLANVSPHSRRENEQEIN